VSGEKLDIDSGTAIGFAPAMDDAGEAPAHHHFEFLARLVLDEGLKELVAAHTRCGGDHRSGRTAVNLGDLEHFVDRCDAGDCFFRELP
jgi:hypothetical protein